MEYNKENSVQKILVGYGVRDGIREMTLEQYREQITSRFTQNKVEALRRCEDEQQREALKRNSFYILPQGCIRENRRQYALGVQPTKENIAHHARAYTRMLLPQSLEPHPRGLYMLAATPQRKHATWR